MVPMNGIIIMIILMMDDDGIMMGLWWDVILYGYQYGIYNGIM